MTFGQWLQMIVQARPSDERHPNDTADLVRINDIRNGLLVDSSVHKNMGFSILAVLVVRHFYVAFLERDSNKVHSRLPTVYWTWTMYLQGLTVF